MPEYITFGGLVLNTLGLVVVLFKLVWGSAAGHHAQFSLLERACTEAITAVKNELLVRIENQSANLGNITSNIGDRIHQLELKTMEFRAIAAETYMRRDNYYKAAEEFKRDVKEAHDDLKQEMHNGFDQLKEQINAVSMTIEENRKTDRRG